MRHRTLWAETLDGWRLQIKRFHDPATFDPSKKPLIFLPGYGMNAFILAYHPSGVSMVEYLVQRGYEVWTANMRGQGASQRGKASRRFGFKELALIDVPTVRRFVGLETASTRAEADLIGCSLGASIAYAYLAAVQRSNCEPSQHHSWFGRHSHQSGHGVFTERAGRGTPCRTRP